MADQAQVKILRPMPDKMAEFVPLHAQRDAHIAARDSATMRRQILAGEETVSKDRLKELDDEVAMHSKAIEDCSAAMRQFQYEAQD